MNRYIDFEIAREYLHKACECLGSNGGLMLTIKFDEEPTADVAPVVHGEWIAEPFGYGECSHCHAKTGNRFAEKFCYNCGARMDGGK